MSRELTKKEKNWIKRFKKCLSEKPKSISLYIENIGSEFQVYDTNTKEILDIVIKHGFEQGDPMDRVFDMNRYRNIHA